MRELLLRDPVAHRELLGIELRLFQHEVGHEALRRELLVHVRLHCRLLVVGLDHCRRRALLQLFVFELHAEAGKAGLGGLQLQPRVLELLFE